MISRKGYIFLIVPVLVLGLAWQTYSGTTIQAADQVAALDTGVHPRNLNPTADVTATTLVESFPDPLGGWTSRWLYQNSNAESHYVAGGNCDADYRGNQLDGIWISDDQGCGNGVIQSPVRIDFTGGFGDDATAFSLDQFACVSGVTFNIYDKDGILDDSVALPTDCWNWTNYSYTLSNGISAFEYVYTGSQVEGNTSIDNVTLEITPPFNVCLMDERYLTEYWFNVEGGSILRGLAYYPNVSFPAPLTGYYNASQGTASFTIGYKILDQSRHYFLNDIGGLRGYTWGLLEDSSFYETPRQAQMTGCTAAPAARATGESGVSK